MDGLSLVLWLEQGVLRVGCLGAFVILMIAVLAYRFSTRC